MISDGRDGQLGDKVLIGNTQYRSNNDSVSRKSDGIEITCAQSI